MQADTLRRAVFAEQKSDEDTSGTTTPLPANYAVSPRELSLRLHEVIESRLEERVKELEIALENSQRKLQLMESEQRSYYKRNIHNYGQSSPFCRKNPLTYDDDCDPLGEPLVMNLSGEALDAYNEAYEELIKTDESEENSPSCIDDDDVYEEGSLQIQLGGANVSMAYFTGNGKVTTTMEGRSSCVCEINDVTEGENGDSDHEMEEQMIRQIVDRTKKRGSSVFQNVQMIQYSVDQDEH